ncbi:MAG: Type 1 glutamine amidotransferase-like domain-containing protein [Gemmatimonadaceae bacterium]
MRPVIIVHSPGRTVLRMVRYALLGAVLVPATLLAQVPRAATGAPRVGPPRGTVIVVGGGSMGPEIYQAFIDAAGGPDALILDVPNAGGADSYPSGPGSRTWRQAGARNIQLFFTKDPRVADSDSFSTVVKKAGGVWFQGGRQFRLVDAYGGTKTEAEFNAVLARGGVVGGSSAGASILGDFLVRGAPSNNNLIMDYPGYQKGFAYLRGVGVDQHVVARERLADLADSIIPRYPQLLGISSDEGTAWVVRGDTGTIVGRSKAFVYGGNDPNDDGKPFLTLFPGDVYDLGARRVMRRAYEGSEVTPAFIQALFSKYENASAGGATVLVAKDGKVLVDRSFGIPPQPRYMPTTTVPQFSLGRISDVFTGICSQLSEPTSIGVTYTPSDSATPVMNQFQRCVAQRASSPVGLHKTVATDSGEVFSNVDELYRMSLGLEQPLTYSRVTSGDAGANREGIDRSRGWEQDRYRGVARYRAFASAGGRRGVFVRVPERKATILILTNDESADVRGMSDAIAEKLLGNR